MKKIVKQIRVTVFLLLSIWLWSPFLQAKIVNEENAAVIAKKIISSTETGTLRLHQVRLVKQDVAAQPYYIFTGADGKGFVIVSADDIARPILGYSVDAEITSNGNLPAPMEQWLASVSRQILRAQQEGTVQSSEVAELWNAVRVGSAIVKLQTAQWGQSSPFNAQCPIDMNSRSLTGCVPTAYAILMKYYGYPTSGRRTTPAYVTQTNKLSVPERNLNHEYNWEGMPLSYKKNFYTSVQASRVATLMADIGAALQVDYTQDATSGVIGQNALYSYFDYFPGRRKNKDKYSSEEWEQMLRKELDMKRPVIYRADNTDGGGHAFLLDGYTDDAYFSVNWGWQGSYNGYFVLDALHPGTSKYDSGQAAWFDCVPMPYLGYDDVAQIGDQKYPSLGVAIGESPTGMATTISMLADEDFYSILIPEGKEITILLNGKSLRTQAGIDNYGSLTVIGEIPSQIMCEDNFPIFANYCELNIKGGVYKNALHSVSGRDYRRCLWTAKGSKTCVSDVTFECGNQVVCTNGKLTIESGVFTCTGNSSVILNYCTTDTLKILDGKFTCNAESSSDSDYRRCVWTSDSTNTQICGGMYVSAGNVVCTNGKLTIESGEFTCTGNSSVVSNYCITDTVKIQGGNLYNVSEIGSAYRRCVWTAENSKTYIGDASFVNIYGPQVLCFNGAAIIDGAEIDNENGKYGCLVGSTGSVVIESCRLSAETILYANGSGKVRCKGGLYSAKVGSSFLEKGYQCVENTQEETAFKYPYTVQSTSNGVFRLTQECGRSDLNYNIQGILLPDMHKGLNIIRKSDGKTVKVFSR